MAVRYYDDLIVEKLKRWLPTNSKMRILKPDETGRFFSTHADDQKDAAFKLPLLAVSRSKDIELLSNIKQSRSFDGLQLIGDKSYTAVLNVIPISVSYQLDIYTKTFEEGDEYVRQLLFKLINNPTIVINIPYNNDNIKAKLEETTGNPYIRHIANLRVLSTISDTSDISERTFSGQFTRWTIQLELQDGFLFSIPYKENWELVEVDLVSKDQSINELAWRREDQQVN